MSLESERSSDERDDRAPFLSPGALRTSGLTALALLAFAGNSILGRLALRETPIDPATFTTIRLGSGALALGLIALGRGGAPYHEGSWGSAWALFVYAVAFSFSYVTLPAATGALLLFGAVQLTMIGYGIWRGERLVPAAVIGLALAGCGVIGLLLPGIERPPWVGSALMLVAGVAWGVYSLRGRGVADPMRSTAGCFLRATPLAVALSVARLVINAEFSFDGLGAFYALLSGVVTSACGYAIWYAALRSLPAVTAAVVQLSVPVLVSVLGVLVLSEAVTTRLVGASVAVLGGIAIVALARRPSR